MEAMIYHSRIREERTSLEKEAIMRKIVGQYITRHGELKAIFAVSHAVMKQREIIVGERYEIAYKLGNNVGYLESKLVQVTDDYRTLFFENPDVTKTKRIGIPLNSILKFYLK